MCVLHVMRGLDDARWIQYQTGMCVCWKSGISTSTTSIIITAADAEPDHGPLMGREEIVSYDKPIAAACDAGGRVFRENRKGRQKEYRVSRRTHIGQCSIADPLSLYCSTCLFIVLDVDNQARYRKRVNQYNSRVKIV